MASGYVRTLPSGRIQAVYYTREGGKRTPHHKTFEHNQRRAANAWLTKMKAAVDAGTWRDPAGARQVFADYVAQWQDNQVVQTSTAYRQASDIKRLLIPEFGPLELGHIDRQLVQAFVKRLAARGYTRTSIQTPYGLLRTIMLAAVDDGLIGVSPCRRIKLPAGKPARTPVILTAEQAALVLAKLDDRAGRALVLTALGTGLRWQEVAWLHRGDIDLLRGELHVREVLKDVPGNRHGGRPKSLAGERTVPLPRAVVLALAAHLPTGGDEDDLVFRSPQGNVWWSSWFVRSRLRPAAVAAGVAGLQFHDLRRTYTSWLAGGGVLEVARKELLGHARGLGAHERYVWTLPGVREQVLAILDAYLPPPSGAQTQAR